MNTVKKVMGHGSDSVIRKSYQSRLIDADIEGIMLQDKENPSMDIKNITRIERGVHPPNILPTAILSEVDEHMSQISKSCTGYWSEKRRLMRNAQDRYFEAWYKSSSHELPTKRDVSNMLPDSAEMLGDLRHPSTIEKLIRERYLCHYQEVAKCCDSKVFNMRDNVRVLEALARIANDGPNRDILFYPDELPLETMTTAGKSIQCPHCRIDLSR
jgi:hypothetical protein